MLVTGSAVLLCFVLRGSKEQMREMYNLCCDGLVMLGF